ncbi:expansin-B5-like [Nicotiana tabacum]|uniref:Expansin-B5-like n=2 Tax=Nicotiana TaxID=4085 RepID=A0AC58S6N7_TOBAC
MAKPRQGEKLRNLGRINISYKRVACKYKTNIMFKVDKGSNRFFFAVAIEAENGDGALSLVEIKTTNSNKWIPMQQMFGATWCVHINPNTQKPPFSLRLTSEYKHQIKANNIIPVGWQSRTIYKSNVNFPNKL